jgi:hypothetical protein
MDEIESAYRAQSEENHFRVLDESGREVLNCGNLAGAEQYAALLNQAFKRGYKTGFREARRSLQPPGKKAQP